MSEFKATETWWRVRKYESHAIPVKVIKSTDKTLMTVYNGRTERASIWSDYYRHFRSATEAANHIVARDQQEFDRAKLKLAAAKEFAAQAARIDAENPHIIRKESAE